jgi:hypothetical protein
MRSFQHASAVLAIMTALVAGCGHRESDGHQHDGDKPDVVGVTFNAKYGLLVPPETARFIGLQVVDVEERKVSSVLQFSAHIYRAANEAQFASAQASESAAALASASLSSADADLLRLGQSFNVQSEAGDTLSGRVVGVNRDLEKASGHVEVLLAIIDERARLARGAFVSIAVLLAGEKDAVSIPCSALLRTAQGDFVYTVSGEHFVRAPVKVGMVNHDFVEIGDGLYSGDRIVINPVMTLWLAELQSLRGGIACADGH